MKAQRLGDLVRVCVLALSGAGFSSAWSATLTVTNINDSGNGSLRQAILLANLTGGVPDLISFNIPGTPPRTITVLTPLPAITDPVVIDGYLQPGATTNSSAIGDNAVINIVIPGQLLIDTSNSTVRGVSIRQIQIGATPGPKGSNVVEGCFIGLDATGTNSLNSPGFGVFVQTPGNRIGGATTGARNLISSNATTGIELFEAYATNNVVQGNYIGTDRTGTKSFGNNDRALVVNANAGANTIGGTNAGAGNVISGHLNRGITLDGANNVVQGNRIGTDATGQLPLGNYRTGVEIGGPGNRVGGTNVGAANIIAFNGVNGEGNTTNGVDVKIGATGYSILGNSIFDNLGLGIDVNANGAPTAGYPLVTLASNTVTTTVIRGSNAPSASFLLQLFTNPTADPSGFGEGKTLLVTTNIATDAGGNFGINWPVALAPGLYLTATANGTTEFSPARLVTAAGTINSWTNTLSGKWEVGPNWSLQIHPFIGQSLVSITNAGSKTVNNDATTATGFPTSLIVSNLVVGAPAGATNTLLLAHGNTNTPLRILRSLLLNSGGAMVVSNAGLNLEGNNVSHINGAATLTEGVFNATNGNQLYIGSTNFGSLTVSGGTFRATYPILGINTGGNGTLHIAGGESFLTQTFDLGDSLTATGTVRVTDGYLTTRVIYVGLFGTGNLFVSGGTFQCESTADIASQPGSVGTFIASGGGSIFEGIILGEGVGATGTIVVTNSGIVYVTDTLDNRHGTIRLDSSSDGGMFVANLLVKPTSQFIFNQGLLLTVSAVVSNNTPFVVGDGTHPAEYRLYLGGTNRFHHGLRIVNNGSLTGDGLVVGTITNFGVVAPSSQFLLSGNMGINGSLILSNSSDLRFDILGFGVNDSIRSTGTVVLNGKLSVSITNGFESVMTNGATFTVMSNSTPFTGAFTNVASGGLLTTTDGYARFTVLYPSRTVVLTNLVVADTDNDGMPDWWEDQFQLDKNVADAGQDYDGDGASNLNEFRAGTQPDSALSVFRLVSLQRETSNVRLTWTTVNGKRYVLQTNAPSANGSITTNFADASSLIVATNAGESITNFLHTGVFSTNPPARYYRVRLATGFN